MLSALGHRHQDVTANPAKKYFIGSVRGQERSWSWGFGEEFGSLGNLTTIISFGRQQGNLGTENIFGALFLLG